MQCGWSFCDLSDILCYCSLDFQIKFWLAERFLFTD